MSAHVLYRPKPKPCTGCQEKRMGDEQLRAHLQRMASVDVAVDPVAIRRELERARPEVVSVQRKPCAGCGKAA